MKFKKKLLINIAVPVATIGTLVGLPIASLSLAEKYMYPDVDNSKFEKYADDFIKTDRGDILRLPLNENPIPVLLGNMDDKTKMYIVDGINALDNISENINYVIYDANKYDKTSGTDYIKFEIVDSLTDYGRDENAAGLTSFNFDKKTGEILYPIEIKLEKFYADGYWDSEFTQSILTTIVKHELMHTLGFKDLYNEDDKNRSIMYYSLDPKLMTYTQEDVEKIQYCYDGKEIATTYHPNQIQYINWSSYLNEHKKQLKHEDEYSF